MTAADAAWWLAGSTAATTSLSGMASTLSTNTDAAGWAEFQADLAAAQQSVVGHATSGAWKDLLNTRPPSTGNTRPISKRSMRRIWRK